MTKTGEWLRVDPGSPVPLFDQLRQQTIEAIRDGRLSPGARLPTVRELAGQLGLAANTVARAYRELETAGIVETRRRFGTFVAHADPAGATMAAAAHTYAETARALGVDRAQALGYLEVAFADGQPKSSRA